MEQAEIIMAKPKEQEQPSSGSNDILVEIVIQDNNTDKVMLDRQWLVSKDQYERLKKELFKTIDRFHAIAIMTHKKVELLEVKKDG